MGFMQFNIIIVSACIYSCETVYRLSSEYVTCVLIYKIIEDSITMVVEKTIKEIAKSYCHIYYQYVHHCY